MRYWRVEFDDRDLDNQMGWLEFDDVAGTNRLLKDDGSPVVEGISYTTRDTNPTPPSWSQP